MAFFFFFYSAPHTPFQLGATPPPSSRTLTTITLTLTTGDTSPHLVNFWPVVRLLIYKYLNLPEDCGWHSGSCSSKLSEAVVTRTAGAFFFFFFFWLHCMDYGSLVPWSGSEPGPLQWSPNHWSSREDPLSNALIKQVISDSHSICCRFRWFSRDLLSPMTHLIRLLLYNDSNIWIQACFGWLGDVAKIGPLYNSARLHLGDTVLVKYKEITLFLCHAGRGVIGGGGSEESHSVQGAGGWSARGLLFWLVADEVIWSQHHQPPGFRDLGSTCFSAAYS